MLKGFLRLSVVASVVALVPMTLFLVKDAHRYLEFISPQLCGLASFEEPSSRHWCVIVATPEFLARERKERVALAEAFFREEIEPFAANAHINTEGFRARFISTATWSLDEAPVQVSPGGKQYRNLSNHAWHGGIQLWKVLLISCIPSVIVGVVISGSLVSIYAVIRWVAAGFRTN